MFLRHNKICDGDSRDDIRPCDATTIKYVLPIRNFYRPCDLDLWPFCLKKWHSRFHFTEFEVSKTFLFALWARTGRTGGRTNGQQHFVGLMRPPGERAMQKQKIYKSRKITIQPK